MGFRGRRARLAPSAPPPNLHFHRSCTKGELIPSTRAPAAVVLPSMKWTLTAGACVAGEGGKGVACEPGIVAAYRYTPPMLLPPRTTPAGAITPACSLRAALGLVDQAPKARVLLAPVTVECDSLADLAAGACGVTNGRASQRAGEVGDGALAAMTEALGLPAAA